MDPEMMSNFLQTNDGIYSEFSVDNILQNLNEERKREELDFQIKANKIQKENAIAKMHHHDTLQEDKCEKPKIKVKGSSIKEEMESTKDDGDDESEKININLNETNLWKSFHRLTNEMILTKTGRYLLFCSFLLILSLFLPGFLPSR